MPSSDVIMRAEERAIIIEAASLVADAARDKSSWSKRIPGAISVSEVREWKDGLGIYIKVDLNKAPEARAYEYGSGIHATHFTASPRQLGAGGFIEITPRNSPFLAFMGTHEWEGQLIVVPPMGGGIVHHPGVEARPFLKPATDENRARIREILGKAVRQSISNTIRESWYHGKE